MGVRKIEFLFPYPAEESDPVLPPPTPPTHSDQIAAVISEPM